MNPSNQVMKITLPNTNRTEDKLFLRVKLSLRAYSSF